jgi:hypothetical protein
VSQVEDSERLVARIVEHLAGNGVYAEPIFASKFFPEGNYYADRVLFESTIEWLEAEGILRFDKPYMGGPLTELIRNSVLTGKGYSLLAQDFKNGLSLAQAIRKVNESGTGYAGIGDFVGGILGGFTKSISS